MEILWQDLDRARWDEGHARAAGAWQQDWAYGEAIARIGGRVLRAEVRDGAETVAFAQFTWRKFSCFFHGALCTRGPLWTAPLEAKQKAEIYAALKRSAPLKRPRAVLFTPDEAAASPIGVERMVKVMTGHATVLLDLTQGLEALRAGMHGKWRNRLVAAEKAGLKVQPNGVKPGQYQWLLEREAEQRRAVGYKAHPVGLVEAFQAAKPDRRQGVITLRVDEGRDPVAGMMFLIHGASATYHIGWSSEAGRETGAHNLLLWNGIEALAARGVRRLDLGGVDTAEGAGIARFKLGAGGDVAQLAGTFC
jgi:hypothetical protein